MADKKKAESPAPNPAERAVAVLNEALAADREGIQAFMRQEVLVNDALASHPAILVGTSVLHPPTEIRANGELLMVTGGDIVLRPLGLINSLFDEQYGAVGMTYDSDTGYIEEFFYLPDGVVEEE